MLLDSWRWRNGTCRVDCECWHGRERRLTQLLFREQVARQWGPGGASNKQDEILDYSDRVEGQSGSEIDAADMSKASLVDAADESDDDSEDGEALWLHTAPESPGITGSYPHLSWQDQEFLFWCTLKHAQVAVYIP